MENKNMCVLFSAFGFDRRFVFQLRGSEAPAGDKKGEAPKKPNPKKALGELAANVEADHSAINPDNADKMTPEEVIMINPTTYNEYVLTLKLIDNKINERSLLALDLIRVDNADLKGRSPHLSKAQKVLKQVDALNARRIVVSMMSFPY